MVIVGMVCSCFTLINGINGYQITVDNPMEGSIIPWLANKNAIGPSAILRTG